MRNLGRILCATAASAVLAVPVLGEDLVVVFETNDPGGEGTATQYFSATHMRSSQGDHDTIFEYATGRIVNIDHEKKAWSEMTLAEVQEAMKAASAQMEQMQAQMEAMPPSMRERMAKMMGGMGGEVTMTKGDTREIAGYPTQEYTVKMGDGMTMKVWNTTSLSLPVPKAELRKLASFSGPMAAMANNPMFKGYSELAQKMSELEGLTLADSTSVRVMGRGSDSSREATSVRTGPIPASEFDVSALAKGYKKVDPPMPNAGAR